MLLFVAVIGVTALLFFQPQLGHYPLAFLCMPLLVWAAFRFRAREVVTAAACMSTIATWATVTGHGPFVMATPNESLLVLQAFTALFTLTALMMSALVQERLALLERERAAHAEARSGAALERHVPRDAEPRASQSAQRDSRRRRRARAARHGAHLECARRTDHPASDGGVEAAHRRFARRCEDHGRQAHARAAAAGSRGPRRDHGSLARGFRPPQASAARPSVGQPYGSTAIPTTPASDHEPVSNAIKFTPSGHVRVRTFAEGREAVLERRGFRHRHCTGRAAAGVRSLSARVQGRDRARGGLGVGLRSCGESSRCTADRSRRAATAKASAASSPCACRARRGPPSSPRHRPAACARGRSTDSLDRGQCRRARVVADGLENAGHDLLEARGRRSGVERAISLRPRLALVDIGLPGIDGARSRSESGPPILRSGSSH